MNLNVTEVTTLQDLKRFVAFPFSLYRLDRHWVPPLRTHEIQSLRKDKNPAFEFCEAKYWLAYRGSLPVGRVAGIINRRYNERWNEKAARFGWFDFIDDSEVAERLLQVVERWASGWGMRYIHGPLGFSGMDGEGVLVEGFEELGTMGALYNYPYYQRHIESAGYSKDCDWVEYQLTMHGVTPERIARLAEIVVKRNDLRILKAKRAKDILPYAKKIFYVLNEAYSDLYGFVELSEKQIDMYVKQYLSFVIPEYVPVVLNAANDVVAFGISLPSMSKALQRCNGRLFPFGLIHLVRALKDNRRVDLYLTAVHPSMQNKGINAVLINETNKAFNKNRVEIVETNRELEGNAKIQAQWKLYESRQHKRRRSYKKHLAVAGHSD